MKYNFAGISTDDYIPFNTVFDESPSDECKWISKKEFHHKEVGLSFKYKYVLQVCYGDDGEQFYELCLVMQPSSFCKEKREELLKDSGCSSVNELTVEDVQSTLMAGVVPMGRATLKPDEDNTTLLDSVAATLDCIDHFRGFTLDRPVNMIGVTGWDLIKEAKGKIKCAIKAALKRIKLAA